MFKYHKLKLKLISDPEVYRMIQPNIRGGICHASIRYACANNKYIRMLYRPEERDSFIKDINATNLYGWAMSQALPYSDFERLSDAQLREAEEALTSANKINALRFVDMATRYAVEMPRVLISDLNGVFPDPPARTDIRMGTAYILEVDLEYLQDIHKCDDEYFLAPEVMEIKTDLISEKQLRFRRLYYGDSNSLSRKLICSLLPKTTQRRFQ